MAAIATVAGALTAGAVPALGASRTDAHRPTADQGAAGFPLTLNSRGKGVVRLQQSLAWLGYDINRRERQEARLGATTQAAIEAIQVKFFWARERRVRASVASKIATIAGEIGALPAACTTVGLSLCIDKTQKVLRYVRDGKVLLTTDVRFGVPGLDTPEGTYTVWFRWENATSGIAGPDQPRTPMPYALFFNGDIAVHHSPTFAAYGYYPGGGSQGCVNVASLADSQWVFRNTPAGTRVHVYSS
jgi:hypothetical protein